MGTYTPDVDKVGGMGRKSYIPPIVTDGWVVTFVIALFPLAGDVDPICGGGAWLKGYGYEQ